MKNLFLDEVDKEYEQLDPLRKKFREMNPIHRLEERHKEQQGHNHTNDMF
ncbi:hypothetical protein [Winogradskyella sp.]